MKKKKQSSSFPSTKNKELTYKLDILKKKGKKKNLGWGEGSSEYCLVILIPVFSFLTIHFCIKCILSDLYN